MTPNPVTLSSPKKLVINISHHHSTVTLNHLCYNIICRSPIRRVNNHRIVKQKIQHKSHGSCFTSICTATIIIHMIYQLLGRLCLRIWPAYDWAEVLPHLVQINFVSFLRGLILKSFCK